MRWSAVSDCVVKERAPRLPPPVFNAKSNERVFDLSTLNERASHRRACSAVPNVTAMTEKQVGAPRSKELTSRERRQELHGKVALAAFCGINEKVFTRYR
jgi:hypothetical protein